MSWIIPAIALYTGDLLRRPNFRQKRAIHRIVCASYKSVVEHSVVKFELDGESPSSVPCTEMNIEMEYRSRNRE